MSEIIYLDLDGVCANYSSSVISEYGLKNVSVKPAGLYSYFTESFMRKSINRLMESYYFWRNLEPYAWSHELLQTIQEYGDVYFLTKGMPNAGCFGGKIDWIKYHFPNMIDKTIIVTQDKWVCSKKGRMLIDDDMRHKKDWEKEGGEFYWWEEIIGTPEGAKLFPEKLDKLVGFLETRKS